MLFSDIKQSDSVISVHIFIFSDFFTQIGYYRILSRVPHAEQLVLVGYLFYI